MRTEEAEYLAPWLDACGRAFGSRPEITTYEHPSLEGCGPLFQIHMPPVFDPPELAGNARAFLHQPKMVTHVRSLGFAWNEEGWIHSFPTPASFNAMMTKISADDCGLNVVYVQNSSMTAPMGKWLREYMSGRIMVHVANGSFYDQCLSSMPQGMRHRGLEFHLVSLGHDLSVHALNYHRIPKECLRAFDAKIRETVPERIPEWEADNAAIPLTLSMFFDNDLNRYCYDVLCVAEDQKGFTEHFGKDSNFAQLMGALETRLQETLDGKGDVQSQDTNDMEPLAQVCFRIPRQH
jgi:hypothetical protein